MNQPLTNQPSGNQLNSIDTIRNGHKGNWFDPATMRYFGTRISSRVHVGHDMTLFVTSEWDWDHKNRRYTVRRAVVDSFGNVRIDSASDLGDYLTLREAHRAAEKML